MQFKQILLVACLLICAVQVNAQQKKHKTSPEFRYFTRVAGKADVVFSCPDGFIELPVKHNGFDFDYGIAIPDQDFEIWFRVIPEKNVEAQDSSYVDLGRTEARSLAGDGNYFMRTIPDRVLTDYNADAGKTFLINLPDLDATKHYKYALLITLQKKQEGTIMAICLTNDKGPNFFRNINRARYCIRFKS